MDTKAFIDESIDANFGALDNSPQAEQSTDDFISQSIDQFEASRVAGEATRRGNLLEAGLTFSGNRQPAQAAIDNRIKTATGVDPSEVEQSMPARAQLMRMLGTTPETFAQQYPRVSAMYSDAALLSIAKNDVEHFKRLEDNLKAIEPELDPRMLDTSDTQPKQTLLSGSAQGAAANLTAGLLGAFQSAVDLANGESSGFLSDVSHSLSETQRELQKWGSKQFKAGLANSDSKLVEWVGEGAQSGFVNFMTAATGVLVAGVTTAVSGGTAAPAAPAIASWVSLGLMGLMSYGSSYSEAKRQGLSAGAASLHGLFNGAVEVLTEKIPSDTLMKMFSAKNLAKGITPENKQFMTNLGKFMISDVAGEQINMLLTGFESWAVLPENADKTFADFVNELPEESLKTFVATIVGSGVTVGAMQGTVSLVESSQGQAAQRIGKAQARLTEAYKDFAVVQSIGEIAANADAAQVAPEQMPVLIERAVGDGIEQVYIDSQVFLQDAKVREQVVAVVPELAEAIDSAIQNGQDVAVGVGTMATILQQEELRSVLYQDVRIRKDGLTVRQAQENLMQLSEDAKKVFDAAANNMPADRRVVLDKIRSDVANQLRAAGYTTADARTQALLWSSFVNTMATRMGMDPDALYERYKPRILASSRYGAVPKRIGIPKTMPKRTIERQARVRQSGAGKKRASFAPTAVTSGKPVIIQNRDRSRPGLVSQMQKIAAAPNYNMVSFSRDFGNGAPVVAYGAVSEGQLGREDFAVTAKGELIRVRYAVVEADSVLVSNAVDGSVNPDYNSADASQMRAIAGNGRIAGLQESFNRGTATQYVEAIKADAETTGIDPAVVNGMQRPILVRIMPAENVTADIGDVSNTSTTAQLSDFQQANNDAERLDFSRITFTEDGSIDESSVIDFIHQMPVSEQDTLITKSGRPTQRAYDRLTYALIAKAYQDDELTQLATESTGEEARNVFKALVAVAPKYIRLLDSDYDLRDVIAGVAHLAIAAQRKGVSLEQHIGLSGDLDFGASAGGANIADPSTIKVAQEVAKMTRSYKSIQSLFSTIADEAYDEMLQVDDAATDMFGGIQARTREEVVADGIQVFEAQNNNTLREEKKNGLDPSGEGALYLLKPRVAIDSTTYDTDKLPIGPSSVSVSISQRRDVSNNGKEYLQKDLPFDDSRLQKDRGDILFQDAWHASPARFDRFSLDFVGTGTGSYVQGWGLYFDPDGKNARGYKREFLKRERYYDQFRGLSGEELREAMDEELDTYEMSWAEFVRFTDLVLEGDFDRIDNGDIMLEELVNEGYNEMSESEKREMRESIVLDVAKSVIVVPDGINVYDLIELYKTGYTKALDKPSEATLYKVEIPDNDVLYDREMQLSEQPPLVQDAIRRLSAKYSIEFGDEDRGFYDKLVRALGGDRKAASLALLAEGVKGMVYFSGATGIVVWDENAIKILEYLQSQQAQEEARGAYSPADRTISLFSKANMSTFLHESGHAYLDIMFDLAGMENTPEDIKRDVQTILDWFGVESLEAWNAMPFIARVPYHEMFARGFESYLREGKAPSSALRRAFARFKDWLVGLYKSAKDLDVEVTPQVKEVMDRMLATEEEISEAKELNRLANLWSEENFPGTPTQWEEYQAITRGADDEAKAQYNVMLLAELNFMKSRVAERRAELDAEFAEEYEKAIQQAESELHDDPVYEMIRDFQGENAPKLSSLEVAQIGNEALQAVGAHGILADDGYSLEPMAQSYGYGDDTVKFVTALGSVKPFDQAVEERAQEIMRDNNPDLMTPEQRQEAAELAALNDLTLRRIETEYKIAAANRANPNVRNAAKEWAADTVGATTVRMLDQNQYRVLAERFARVAMQAAAAHNVPAVAEAKRKQLINLYAQRASIEAKNFVRKTEKLARRLDRSYKKKLRKGQQDQEFMDQALGLMHRFGLLEGEYQTQRSFADFKADLEDKQGVPLSMIDEGLFEGAGRDYRDLTYDEFVNLRSAIDMLLHQGRRMRSVVRQGQREAIEKVVDLLEDELVETFEQEVPTEPSRYREAVNGFFMDHFKLSHLVRKMVGGRNTSTLHEVILDPLNAAGDREATMIREAAEKLNKLTNDKLRKSSMTAKVKIISGKGAEMLTLSTRLAIALNAGNRQNLDRLKSPANGFSKSSVDQVLSSLTKEELEWVQGVWDLIDSYWPLLAEVERRTNGIPPQKVKADPFEVTLADGTVVKMRGGYYPIKYDTGNSVDAARHEMRDFGEGIMKGAVASATTKQNFAKKRSENVDRKLKLDLFVIGSHLKEVIHDVTFRETLQDVNRLLRNGKFAKLIQDRFGARYYKQIVDTLLAVACDGSGAALNAAMHPALQFLKGNATFAALSASVTTVFLQPLGILQSIQRIGFGNVMNGYLRLMRDGAAHDVDKNCLEKSEFMRNRKFTLNAELNEIGRRLMRSNSRFSRGVDLVEKALFAPMQNAQVWLVDIATWYGAYEMAKNAAATEEQAIKIADQTVRDAQGSGLIVDQSPFQRNHPLATVFYSYFSSTLNLMADSWDKNISTRRSIVGKLFLVRDWLMLAVVPALLSELVFSFMRGDDWEDREPEDWAKLGVSVTLGPTLSMFVGLREFTSLLNGYTYTGPIVFRAVNDVGRFGEALVSDDPDAARIMRSGLSFMSNFVKVPATQINRTWKGLEAYAEGETDMPTAVLFGPPKQ